MAFEVQQTKGKVKTLYKSIYLTKTLYEKIENIAIEDNTSFNNVVMSMVNYCLIEEKPVVFTRSPENLERLKAERKQQQALENEQ